VVIPEQEHTTKAAIDRWHEAQEGRRSRRLGASAIGEECARRVWLSFRWARQEKISGRIKRLFRRGHLEEGTVIDDLRAIGCVVSFVGEEQIEVKAAPHIVAYPDGIIESGVIEAPAKRHVLEIKTHSAKSFAALVKDGIPYKHFAQMQTAMHGLCIDRALYVAVCKDNDELYIERVRYDPAIATAILERGQMIIDATEAPLGVSTDPSWYQCKMCPVAPVCHKQEPADRNCRTCAHSTPTFDGWLCEHWGKFIPEHIEVAGCAAYVPHPDMHPGTIVDAGEGWAVYDVGGERVRYGV
jgi:hypothetical protein